MLPVLVVTVLAAVIHLAVFAVLDRPWGCGCGRVWSMPGTAALNSRTLLDPYTALHLAMGAVLVVVVARLRPDLGRCALLAIVLASGTTWEVMENLPTSIHLFGYEAGDPLAYHGDSRLNALADTGAAVLGAALAHRVSPGFVLALALGTEAAVSLWIGDGFTIAALRALRHAG